MENLLLNLLKFGIPFIGVVLLFRAVLSLISKYGFSKGYRLKSLIFAGISFFAAGVIYLVIEIFGIRNFQTTLHENLLTLFYIIIFILIGLGILCLSFYLFIILGDFAEYIFKKTLGATDKNYLDYMKRKYLFDGEWPDFYAKTSRWDSFKMEIYWQNYGGYVNKAYRVNWLVKLLFINVFFIVVLKIFSPGLLMDIFQDGFLSLPHSSLESGKEDIYQLILIYLFLISRILILLLALMALDNLKVIWESFQKLFLFGDINYFYWKAERYFKEGDHSKALTYFEKTKAMIRTGHDSLMVRYYPIHLVVNEHYTQIFESDIDKKIARSKSMLK